MSSRASRPLLSAAMIVRDEEPHLPRCLESIRSVVDEIVIVDTGSTDGTIEIARSFGARVYPCAWEGDFSRARNVSLEMAGGAWILHIDADETLRPVSRAALEARLQGPGEVALLVRRRPSPGLTPHWAYRLWRSDPRIRFVRRIHETAVPDIEAVAEADHMAIGESELYLEHFGYEGDQTHKLERYLPLLRADLAGDPSNAHNWGHLSEALAALGQQDEAGAALARAVQCARTTKSSAGGFVFAELIRQRREHEEEINALLEEGLSLYPNSIALAWEKVWVEIEAERYGTALQWLERFNVDYDVPGDDMTSYPVELFGAKAPQARGLCLFRLGRYREAAAAYRQAEAFAPQELSHRLKRIVAEQRARQEDVAL